MANTDIQLHNTFLFWIGRLAHQMQEQLNQELKGHDVTWVQWALLNVMAQGTVHTPAQAADAIGADRSSVTRMLDKLQARGLVERAHDGLDRRVVKITLTASGQGLAAELNTLAQAHQERFLSSLPSTELRGLKGSLIKLLRAGGVDASALWQRVS